MLFSLGASCEPISDPTFGKSSCETIDEVMRCVITCPNGYYFNTDDIFESNLVASEYIKNYGNYTEITCTLNQPLFSTNLEHLECSGKQELPPTVA